MNTSYLMLMEVVMHLEYMGDFYSSMDDVSPEYMGELKLLIKKIYCAKRQGDKFPALNRGQYEMILSAFDIFGTKGETYIMIRKLLNSMN